MQLRRSRHRFAEYRQKLHDNRRNGQPLSPGSKSEIHGHPRSFWRLFVAFWGMLAGHRPSVIFALATLFLVVRMIAFVYAIFASKSGKPNDELGAPYITALLYLAAIAVKIIFG